MRCWPLFAAALLGGCYVSEQPVLGDGHEVTESRATRFTQLIETRLAARLPRDQRERCLTYPVEGDVVHFCEVDPATGQAGSTGSISKWEDHTYEMSSPGHGVIEARLIPIRSGHYLGEFGNGEAYMIGIARVGEHLLEVFPLLCAPEDRAERQEDGEGFCIATGLDHVRPAADRTMASLDSDTPPPPFFVFRLSADPGDPAPTEARGVSRR